MKLEDLQVKLQYQFNNPELLMLALTHKSYAKTNNERLEFLGDAVLGFVIARMLYATRSTFNEDDMSLARAHLVRGSTLADVARELELGRHLRMGSGELKSGGRERASILADALEATIGAIHEDGGIQACTEVIEQLFGVRMARLDPNDVKDSKTLLQEHLQAAQRALPEYEVLEVFGADHEREYLVACRLDDGVSVEARSSSARKAEKQAAKMMLRQLGVFGD